jgi:hypothetical protein
MLCAVLTSLDWAASAGAMVVEDLLCRGNAATSCDLILGHAIAAEWMLGASISIQPEIFFGTTKPFFTEHYESVLVKRLIGDRYV